jgi:cytochrome b involved in lipid metabolism
MHILPPPTANINSSSSSSSSSSSGASGTHQAWQLKRPVLQHDPKLTRRQLRQLNRTWSLTDVAQHRYCDDGWIAVDSKVYDITEHLVNHPGWDSGCQVTTVLSILAHLGTDCSEEFREIHRPYPVAWKQLQAYYVGELQQ